MENYGLWTGHSSCQSGQKMEKMVQWTICVWVHLLKGNKCVFFYNLFEQKKIKNMLSLNHIFLDFCLTGCTLNGWSSHVAGYFLKLTSTKMENCPVFFSFVKLWTFDCFSLQSTARNWAFFFRLPTFEYGTGKEKLICVLCLINLYFLVKNTANKLFFD